MLSTIYRLSFIAYATRLTRLLRPRRLAGEALALLALLAAGLLLSGWAYRAPRSAALGIDAPPALLPLQGFHEVEAFADRPGLYRWTRGEATIRLPYQFISRGTPNLWNDMWVVSANVINGTQTPEDGMAQLQKGLAAWYPPQQK